MPDYADITLANHIRRWMVTKYFVWFILRRRLMFLRRCVVCRMCDLMLPCRGALQAVNQLILDYRLYSSSLSTSWSVERFLRILLSEFDRSATAGDRRELLTN